MEGALPMIALATVVVSAGVIIVAAHFRKERVTELRQWAQRNGFGYVEHAPVPLADTALPRILQSHAPRARHLLTGRRGRHSVIMFELNHPADRRGGGAALAHRVVAVRTPGPVANLEIRRRDLAHAVPFDERGTPEEVEKAFASAFHTIGGDERFTRNALGRNTISWMLADFRSRSFPVRFADGHVLTWTPMRLDPDRALTAADYLIDLVDRVPSHVWACDTADS